MKEDGKVLISPEAFRRLAHFKKKDTGCVWWALVARVETNNQLFFTRELLAKELKITPTRLSRAITELEEMSLLLKDVRSGNTLAYRFNPTLLWKGTEEEHQRAVEEYEKKKGPHLRLVE